MTSIRVVNLTIMLKMRLLLRNAGTLELRQDFSQSMFSVFIGHLYCILFAGRIVSNFE